MLEICKDSMRMLQTHFFSPCLSFYLYLYLFLFIPLSVCLSSSISLKILFGGKQKLIRNFQGARIAGNTFRRFSNLLRKHVGDYENVARDSVLIRTMSRVIGAICRLIKRGVTSPRRVYGAMYDIEDQSTVTQPAPS